MMQGKKSHQFNLKNYNCRVKLKTDRCGELKFLSALNNECDEETFCIWSLLKLMLHEIQWLERDKEYTLWKLT